MVKKIILTILVIVVIFIILRNIDLKKPGQSQSADEIAQFTPSPDDFIQKSITDDSYLTWYGENKIQGKSHTGTLKFNTDVSFVGLAPKNEAGEMEIVGGQLLVDMTTLEGKDEPEMLVNHLRSADFFDVDTFQEANFVITGKTDGRVQGLLTIKGKTNEVNVPYVLTQESEGQYKIEGTFEIDRTLWDVTTLSGTFFEDIGDSVVEDLIRLNFVIYTTNSN